MLMMNLKGYLLEGPHSRAGVDEQAKKVRTMMSGFRCMTSALKKGASDVQSALNTIKAAEALKERRSGDKRAAQAKAKMLELPAFASTSDPSIIKIHKSLCKRQEVDKAASFETLKTSRDADAPFILRRFRFDSHGGLVFRARYPNTHIRFLFSLASGFSRFWFQKQTS